MSFYPDTTTIPIYSVFTAVGILLTALRFWIRLSYAREPHPRPALSFDDWFILLGLLVVTACTGIQIYNAIDGLSGEGPTHKDNALAKQLVEYRINFTIVAIEKIAFGAIKLSLLCFYHRIFGFWPSFRRVNFALMGIVAVWALAFLLADVLLCGRDISVSWGLDQKRAAEKCGDKGAMLLAFAATSVVTDLFVLVMPLLYIRRLKLARSKKIGASVVFLLGGISTLAGILRLIFLSVAYPIGRLNFGYTPPPNGQLPLVLKVFNPTFWVMIEMLMGVWAANLPVLAPLVRGLSERYRKSSSARSAGGESSSDAQAIVGQMESGYLGVCTPDTSERKGSSLSSFSFGKSNV